MEIELQLALDSLTREEALALVKQVHEYVDIVEIGTPFIIQYGIEFIKDIKAVSSKLKVLCDTKIMDAGFMEAAAAFGAGADYVTILALTDHGTLLEGVKAAHEYHGKIMVDMICVTDIEAKVRELEAIGVDIIGVHTGVDQQKLGKTPIDDLVEIKKYARTAKVAVAGGIKPETIDEYTRYQPDIVIVGGGIAESDDPVRAARAIYRAIKDKKYERCE